MRRKKLEKSANTPFTSPTENSAMRVVRFAHPYDHCQSSRSYRLRIYVKSPDIVSLSRHFRARINFFVHSRRLLVEILYLCHRILQWVQDILLNNLSITTWVKRANLQYWDCNPLGRSFPIFEGGLWWAERCMANVCASCIQKHLKMKIMKKIIILILLFVSINLIAWWYEKVTDIRFDCYILFC